MGATTIDTTPTTASSSSSSSTGNTITVTSTVHTTTVAATASHDGSNTANDDITNINPPFYTRKQLDVFNLLEHPVWIFDIDRKVIWWANEAAVQMWSADSLDSLMQRNFADDMSEATKVRLNDYKTKFSRGETIQEQWTMHPNGGKDGPRTVKCQCKGVRMQMQDDDNNNDNNARLLMMVEGVYDSCPSVERSQNDIDSIRGLETLRHLPVAVRAFDMDGNLQDQNPEALKVFGSETSSDNPQEQQVSEFLRQFVNQEEGQRVLEQINKENDDHELEAEQHTQDGIRWFSIKVHKTKDPVTSKPILLYSARDINNIINSAQERLDKLNLQRSEFFAVMAHELRTPLHQVVGFIELLSKTELDEEQTDYCNLLQSSAHALMAIINDLLDLTKLEAGKMKLESIPMKLQSVMEGTMAAILPRAEERGLSVSLNMKQQSNSEDIPTHLLGDPNRLRQIVLNMLTNAVKFTDKGGTISVNVKTIQTTTDQQQKQNTDDDATPPKVWVRFEVRDTGIGISDEQQKRIFQAYQQADASISRNYGGTGLGLSICTSLVDAMGGRLGLDSALNKGTTFWFEIPFLMDPAHTTDRTELRRRRLLDRQNSTSSLSSIPPPPPTPKSKKCITPPKPTSRKEAANPLRVLVAEDNLINQKVISAMLKRLGHVPTIVENGQLAVDSLLQIMASSTTEDDSKDNIEDSHPAFDIVLMDVQMPVMDGMDATMSIRKNGIKFDSLPIVGLTASIQSLDWSSVGMNDCLKKPLRIADLEYTLNKYCKKEGR